MSRAASQERTVEQAFESITCAIGGLKLAVRKSKEKENQQADPKESREYQLLDTVLAEIRLLKSNLLPAHYDLLHKMWNTIKATDDPDEFPVFKLERAREILYGIKEENKIIKPPTLMQQKKNDETFQSLWEELKEATK